MTEEKERLDDSSITRGVLRGSVVRAVNLFTQVDRSNHGSFEQNGVFVLSFRESFPNVNMALRCTVAYT